jgi:hypothetical protein
MTLLVRVVGGLVFAWILHQTYLFGDLLNHTAQILWSPEPAQDLGYLDWALVQIENLVAIFIVISGLLFTLKVLKILGVEKVMAFALRPILKILGISRAATNMTIIGITLGLSFGGGLLINEAKQGHIPAKDVFTAIMLLNLVHSMIEDTLLIMLIGADFISIFWGRLIFGVIVIAIMSFAIRRMSDATCERYFYKRVVS